jgi:hypothetical protein
MLHVRTSLTTWPGRPEDDQRLKVAVSVKSAPGFASISAKIARTAPCEQLSSGLVSSTLIAETS